MRTLARMRIERVPGFHERRDDVATWELAAGTLACPECDAPVLPSAHGASPAEVMSCGFCGHAAAVRDFLSLGEPTRPTRVVVRVTGLALR